MTRLFSALFGFFLTWWGLLLLAALDSSIFFFVPFGNDAVLVYLVARNRSLFWMYPLLAAAGSIVGAAVTYAIGRKAGKLGLKRLVPEQRLDRLKRRVKDAGAVAIAIPSLLPPPFPLSPFVLTCGALDVNQTRFLITFGIARVVRFGAEASLARLYGAWILRVLQSDQFQIVVGGFVVLAIAGTVVTGVKLWRSTRRA